MIPFVPEPGVTVNINVAATTANVQVTTDAVRRQIRIMNNGTATVWVQWGIDNTVAATTTSSMPVGSGGTEVITVPEGPIYIAAIAAGATGRVYFTPGSGI